MASAKHIQRLVLHLDLRITLEAIILNRVECIPATRRQEWLRGLLVQGFRSEFQALRGAQDDENRSPTTAFTIWRAGGPPKSASRPKSEPAVVKAKLAQAHAASKPFAALGRVIG